MEITATTSGMIIKMVARSVVAVEYDSETRCCIRQQNRQYFSVRAAVTLCTSATLRTANIGFTGLDICFGEILLA